MFVFPKGPRISGKLSRAHFCFIFWWNSYPSFIVNDENDDWMNGLFLKIITGCDQFQKWLRTVLGIYYPVSDSFIASGFCLFNLHVAVCSGTDESILIRSWWIWYPKFERFIFELHWNLTVFSNRFIKSKSGYSICANIKAYFLNQNIHFYW